MSINIRAANISDIAFLVDCNAAMALETEAKTLDHATLSRGTHEIFANSQRGFYLVAELDDVLAGCLLVTYEWSDWRNGDWWWIQSVYVTPAARRHRVFRALYAEVERSAQAAGAVGLRLYVERENTRAQQTYAALGMTEAPYKMLKRAFTDHA